MNLAFKSWNQLWLPWENLNQPSLVADMIGELGVDNGNCFSCIVLLSCQRMAGSHQSQPGNYPDGSGSSKPQERAYWLIAAPCLQSYDSFFFFLFLCTKNRRVVGWAQPMLQGKYFGTARLGLSLSFVSCQLCHLEELALKNIAFLERYFQA